MESIVFFGKGGIGKSTIASNISVILAAKGRRVLHVGCDPKGDSTLALAGRRIKHFADGGVFTGEHALRSSIHPSLVKNVSCVEAGGPQAGVGCAGAGIGAMLDIMKEFSVLEKDGYDAAVFDVLGDVVCGGFAAPLRRGLAGKAVIVVSEEMLSLYAANKLIAMVNNYSRNGVWLAGLAVNAKDREGVRLAEAFALAARTRVLAVIPRDPAVVRAEKLHRTVVTADPRSPAAAALVRLAGAIEAARHPAAPPRTLGDAEFQKIFSGRAPDPAPAAAKAAGERLPPAERIKRAGFTVTGFAGGQVVCSWRGAGGAFDVLVAPDSEAREGMARSGDWAFCFAPDRKDESSVHRPELEAAAASLAGVCFDDFIASFGGGVDFYGNVQAFDELSSHAQPARDGRPKEPHLGFGQWHRFVFPGGDTISVPPGAVMLEHGDCECRFSSASRTPLSTFQKSSGGLAGSSRLSLEPLLPKEDPVAVNTGFTYADAVRGDGQKVAAALDAAAKLTGPGGLIEFYATCSPILLATDSREAFEKASAGGVRILKERFNSFYTGSPEKIAARADFAARRIRAAGKTKAQFDVHLCGMGSSFGPLAALLSQAGVSTAPEGGDLYRNVASSRLQVLAEPDPVMTGALDGLRRPWLCPPAPYGMAATRAWLGAVLKALGRKKAVPGPARETAALWRELSKKAGAYAAVFAAEASELTALDGGSQVYGVPLLSFLAEAGFGLRLLAHGASPAVRAEAGSALKALPAAVRRRAALDFFDSPKALYGALKADRAARLLYSDIPMDPRAAAAGKIPFSSSVFEPGYEGAAETLRRLTALCEWDLNGKRFSKSL